MIGDDTKNLLFESRQWTLWMHMHKNIFGCGYETSFISVMIEHEVGAP